MATAPNQQPQGHNISSAAKYLGTSNPTILRMLRDGTLAHRRYGRRIFIARETLDNFLRGEQ